MTDDDWDSGKLGRDDKYAKRADPAHERALDEALRDQPFGFVVGIRKDLEEIKRTLEWIKLNCATKADLEKILPFGS